MKKMVLIGNVGREPQTRTNKNGKEFVEFSIAVNDGNEDATWVSVIFNRTSKVIDFLKKGKQVYIEGKFDIDVYKGEPSITLYANDIQLLGTKSDTNNSDIVDRKPDTY